MFFLPLLKEIIAAGIITAKATHVRIAKVETGKPLSTIEMSGVFVVLGCFVGCSVGLSVASVGAGDWGGD